MAKGPVVILTLALLLVTVPLGAVLGAQTPAPVKTAEVAGVGTVLTGPNGMTLYTYASDRPGKSTCAGGCAQSWPPFQPGPNDPTPKAPLSVITRDDGSKQYAYESKPLYFFVGDKKPGDAKGHKLGGVWFTAQPGKSEPPAKKGYRSY